MEFQNVAAHCNRRRILALAKAQRGRWRQLGCKVAIFDLQKERGGKPLQKSWGESLSSATSVPPQVPKRLFTKANEAHGFCGVA